MTQPHPEQGPPTRSSAWVCSLCGTTSVDAAEQLSWSVGSERGRVQRVCPVCARTHVRSIESKLDSDWW